MKSHYQYLPYSTADTQTEPDNDILGTSFRWLTFSYGFNVVDRNGQNKAAIRNRGPVNG